MLRTTRTLAWLLLAARALTLLGSLIVSGRLAERKEESASAIRSLLEDPVVARAMGAASVERARERFLLPRLLLDEWTSSGR